MYTVKYDNKITMEDLSETSTEITLVHVGKEACKPYHAFSGIRDEYILHFILSGNGFYSVNKKTWSLSAGQMFLIYPEEPVVYCADKTNPWTYIWIGFKGLGANTVIKNCGFSKNNPVLPAPALEEYIGCIDDLFDHNSMSFSNGLYRESSLLRLFAILANHHADPALRDTQQEYSDNAYINSAIDYINKMYMQNISVSEIADSIGISRAYLNHIFQQEFNVSVQNYLIDFRMNKSANLLASTTLSIKEISNQVGYNDPLVFSKAFKKKFEMSPKSYRTYKAGIEPTESIR